MILLMMLILVLLMMLLVVLVMLLLGVLVVVLFLVLIVILLLLLHMTVVLLLHALLVVALVLLVLLLLPVVLRVADGLVVKEGGVLADGYVRVEEQPQAALCDVPMATHAVDEGAAVGLEGVEVGAVVLCAAEAACILTAWCRGWQQAQLSALGVSARTCGAVMG